MLFSLETSTDTSMTAFKEDSAKEYANFAKLLTCAKQPLKKTCKKCFDQSNGYKLFYFFQTSRLHRYRYKIMIHYNDKKKKVVVSFAGPNVQKYAKYVSLIYSNGFAWVKRYKVQIESEFKTVYFRKLRQKLVQKLKQMKKSGRGNYRFIFTGHSVGGSIAVLASLDLTKSGLISKDKNKTKVYTFGSLRIGDQKFVALVHSSVYLYTIVNTHDYVVRYPTCYYSITFSNWRCYTGPLLTRYIVSPWSPVYNYWLNYRYSLYYSVPEIGRASCRERV